MNRVDSEKSVKNAKAQHPIKIEAAIIIKDIIYLLCGFIFAKIDFLEVSSPLGTAFAAAAPSSGYFFSLAGVLTGTLLPTSAGNSMRYLAAVTAVAGVRWALSGAVKAKHKYIFSSVLSFVSLCATGMAIAVYSGDSDKILIVVSEALLGAGGTYIIQQAMEYINGLINAAARKNTREALRIRNSGRDSTKPVSLMLFVLLLVSGASTVQYSGFSPVRALTVTAVMACAYMFGAGACALCGAGAGIAMSINSSTTAYYAVAYAFSGFTAGLFSKSNKLLIAAAYLSANLITGLAFKDTDVMLTGLYEAAIGTVLFMLIPPKLVTLIRTAPKEKPKPRVMTNYAENRLLSLKIEDAADTMSEIACAVNRAADIERHEADSRSIADTVKERLCSKCDYKRICHNDNGRETQLLFDTAEKQLKERGELDTRTVPMRLIKKCRYPYELTALFNGVFDEQLYRASFDRKMAEIRRLMTRQYDGMARLMRDAADNIAKNQGIDIALTEKVREILHNSGIEAKEVCCSQNGDKAVSVTVTVKADKKHSSDDICRIVSEKIGKNLTVWQSSETKEGLLINLRQRHRYKIKTGVAQHSYENGRLCGDSFKTFYNTEGRYVSLISDGMGTGAAAALDSELASGIMLRLIKSGFDYDSALDSVNCALMLKSGDESLSTLDICEIDTDSGTLLSMKAGAPPTLILHSGKVERIDCACLPVGILCDVAFDKKQLTIKPGDILLMFSDGILGSGMQWLEQELLCCQDDDMQLLADRIVEQAQLNRVEGKDDDITVMAVTLTEAA